MSCAVCDPSRRGHWHRHDMIRSYLFRRVAACGCLLLICIVGGMLQVHQLLASDSSLVSGAVGAQLGDERENFVPSSLSKGTKAPTIGSFNMSGSSRAPHPEAPKEPVLHAALVTAVQRQVAICSTETDRWSAKSARLQDFSVECCNAFVSDFRATRTGLRADASKVDLKARLIAHVQQHHAAGSKPLLSCMSADIPGKMVEFSCGMLNDGVCDCADGSDEWGTGACHATRFRCTRSSKTVSPHWANYHKLDASTFEPAFTRSFFRGRHQMAGMESPPSADAVRSHPARWVTLPPEAASQAQPITPPSAAEQWTAILQRLQQLAGALPPPPPPSPTESIADAGPGSHEGRFTVHAWQAHLDWLAQGKHTAETAGYGLDVVREVQHDSPEALLGAGWIPSAWVGDGVCDCCDGADEMYHPACTSARLCE